MKLASFEALVAALENAGVRYLVAGGLAVNAYGYLRLTHDVDLVPRVADRLYVISRHGIIAEGEPSQVFVQQPVLDEARIEPPILAQLALKLGADKMNGRDLPLDVDSAVKWIRKNL